MNKPESARIITILFLMAILIFPFFVLASTTDGTIDSTYKYAWGENAGWINFGTSGGNVHIMDSALTGYAWSENYGWINLSPANGGVLNDGNGDLSGNAWGENLGWINFASVSINSSGNFSGTAVISNDSSLISFNCAGCSVKTDWRPASARTTSVFSGAGPVPTMFGLNLSSGGNIFGGFTIKINNGAKETSSRDINLTLYGGFDAKTMMISEKSDFSDAVQAPYSTSTVFTLSQPEAVLEALPFPVAKTTAEMQANLAVLLENLKAFQASLPGAQPATPATPGEKIIYVKFYNQEGKVSPIISARINLKAKPTEIKVTSFDGKINKFTKPLFVGLKNNDVKNLQEFLKNQEADIYPEGLATGYFGQLTKKAVQRFQLKENIVKNSKDPGYGYVGPKTRAKINLILGF